MKWIVKATVQRALSALPHGDEVNHLLQRRVTKQLPRSDEHFRLHADETLRHFHAFTRHSPGLDPAESRFYEFGAGWDLIAPLTFYALGVGQQTLVDIRANVRFREVNHAIGQCHAHRGWLEELAGRALRPVPPEPVASIKELEQRFGITYLAPLDARATGLPSESVDFVSNTNTLEHIPPADIARILVECRRLLTEGGVISSAVDMQDHYSFFDPSISAFNFLKFGDRTWSLVNSPLHHQNRLRLPDHRRLFERAGLAVVEQGAEEPSEADLEIVNGLRLAPRFRGGYSPGDLATRSVRLIGVKSARGNDPVAAQRGRGYAEVSRELA